MQDKAGHYSATLTHWCDACGQPITEAAQGWIKTNPLAIKERRDQLDHWHKTHPGSYSRGTYPNLVPWFTFHTACDPWPEATRNSFGVGSARTERHLLQLTTVVIRKRWCVHTAWASFITKTLAANAATPTNERS